MPAATGRSASTLNVVADHSRHGRCNERPYHYAWGVGNGESGWLERIVKADLEHRETSIWS